MARSKRGRGRRSRDARWLPWGIVGLVVLLIGLVVGRNIASSSPGGAGPREQEWLEGVSGVSYDKGATDAVYPNPADLPSGRRWLPALGAEDAPVVVLEFTDAFCNHCRDFSLDNLPAILDDYVATGQVRYVGHYYGFASSMERGVVQADACAAEQGRYFEFKHALFQSIQLGDFNIDRAARIAGIDAQQFNQCRDEGRYAEALQEMLFVDNNGVSATPTFFVNDQQVAGNDPAGLRRLIEAELAAPSP
jgi:protein-disulfide isomerase